MACVNDVTDSLKSCSKIYYFKRGKNEVRVNDYNPLLLMLWRANMDLQYISETSLALTEYVSGYVTKAEKSNVQDIWNDISNSDSVYKRLFQFGMRNMRSREVGLYEAIDIPYSAKFTWAVNFADFANSNSIAKIIFVNITIFDLLRPKLILTCVVNKKTTPSSC